MRLTDYLEQIEQCEIDAAAKAMAELCTPDGLREQKRLLALNEALQFQVKFLQEENHKMAHELYTQRKVIRAEFAQVASRIKYELSGWID